MDKSFVKQELRNLNSGQLMQYGTMHGYSISSDEADDILTVIKKPNIDPFNEDGFEQVFQNLALSSNQTTATKAKNLFRQVMRSNGLQHLFDFNL